MKIGMFQCAATFEKGKNPHFQTESDSSLGILRNLFSKIVYIVKKANWSMTSKSNRKIGLMVADLQL